MKYISIFLVLTTLLISLSTARKVLFSVVVLDKDVNNVFVKIGKKKYALKQYNPKNHTPLYRATLTVSDAAISYNYIANGVSESFTRTLAKNKKKTHNEFFGRKVTVKKLPQFPTLGTWKRSVGKGELFDDSYIPTVHLYGKEIGKFFSAQKPKLATANNIDFILKNNVYSFQNIKVTAKNLAWRKFQFKVYLKNNGIQGRYILKFRDNNEDPTFMRQDLYGDILNALGYPTIQSIKARVYVNNKPVGYYILQEEAPSDSFVRSAFHGDNNGKYLITKINKLGYPVEAGTGADFYYTGNKFNSFSIKDSGHGDISRVKLLAKAFQNLNAKNDNEVKKFEKEWFDIDTFLKAIAMQYLTGSYDSYWFFSSNFALYDDPTQSKNGKYKFYFICQDWDATFGINASKLYLRYDDYILHSYKDYVNVKWGQANGDSPYRYAIDKLFQNKNVRNRFETLLKNIVKNIFNPVAISQRLDALVERHRNEIKWNYKIINKYPLRSGRTYFTYNDFVNNINEGVDHSPYGIKQFVYLRAKAIKEEFGIKVNLGNVKYIIYSTDRCGKGLGICAKGLCCSKYGYCGKTKDHCNAGCQSEFGQCNKNKRNVTITKIQKRITTSKY